jgi:ceramide glucosyltransferase
MSSGTPIVRKMTILIWLTASFCAFTLLLHITSALVTAYRCRPPRHELLAPKVAPAITLVRPLCGLDHRLDETLLSSFDLDYPNYRLIFDVADADDPVVPLIRTLIAARPSVPATLLIGDERISINPKLNNCIRGWDAATTTWVVLADANVLMPRDYLQRLLAAWDSSTGLVSSPPIGADAQGFWAELECAFLNSYQARWQYFADWLGFGFAQGKNLFWYKPLLERAGGIRALASEVAEDAASTKLVRAAGLNVRLVDAPFPQPLGRRLASEVWKRQARWSQLRRASFPAFFIPEVLAGALVPAGLAAIVAWAYGVSPAAAAISVLALWYGSEALISHLCGWPLTWRFPFAVLLRDLMLPFVWMAGWRNAAFEWRGNGMRVKPVDTPSAVTPD